MWPCDLRAIFIVKIILRGNDVQEARKPLASNERSYGHTAVTPLSKALSAVSSRGRFVSEGSLFSLRLRDVQCKERSLASLGMTTWCAQIDHRAGCLPHPSLLRVGILNSCPAEANLLVLHAIPHP